MGDSGSQILIQEDTGPFFKTVLQKSHGSDRGLRIAVPHHQPPTTRSQEEQKQGDFNKEDF